MDSVVANLDRIKSPQSHVVICQFAGWSIRSWLLAFYGSSWQDAWHVCIWRQCVDSMMLQTQLQLRRILLVKWSDTSNLNLRLVVENLLNLAHNVIC
jgi:hypothetical protein